ncbi:MAG: hypothetical protein GY841_13455 [FCB group bacterium]|nr:hypothetical protein [FCB group bacterium]
MKRLGFTLLVIVIIAVLSACTREKQLAREELPLIKETVFALEQVIKLRSAVYIDSIVSSDANRTILSADSLFDFIYSDGTGEFSGFTGKRIVYRGDAARIDCFAPGPDSTEKPLTITLHKENDLWLVKNIEPGLDIPILEDVDTTGEQTP